MQVPALSYLIFGTGRLLHLTPAQRNVTKSHSNWLWKLWTAVKLKLVLNQKFTSTVQYSTVQWWHVLHYGLLFVADHGPHSGDVTLSHCHIS